MLYTHTYVAPDMTAPTADSDVGSMTASGATAPLRASTASESTIQQRNHDEPRDETRSERALRVTQMDADEMDSGLIHMLNAKISRALGVFGPSYESKYAPEVALVLKLLLYRLGVWSVQDRATPGLKLQNLRYAYGRDRNVTSEEELPCDAPSHTTMLTCHLYNPTVPTRSLYLLPLLSTIPSYVVSRLHMQALSSSFPEYPRGSLQRRWWLLLERFLAVGKFVELCGFLTFLWDGKYPNVMARVLKMRLIPQEATADVTRMISYEFMNRQLVWAGFTEFLVFLLPILQARHGIVSEPLKRAIQVLKKGVRFFRAEHVAQDYEAVKRNGHAGSKKPKIQKKGRLWHLPATTCPLCYLRLRPTVDHQLGLPTIPPPPLSVGGGDVALSAEAVDTHALAELMHNTTTHVNEVDTSETEIHIPTRTDCEAGCTYCYYCIAHELSALAKEAQQTEQVEGTGGKESANKSRGKEAVSPKGWECLRCSSEVFGCHRVVINDTVESMGEEHR
ncbi:hypothetical protein QFC21_003910 [Naganishia friedmannii]|uniref:Uncharacterized protein n=1 Tax=Naganishia friedmannii TaxID=89922 RepID=A0ACC2VLF7_9TREE|nr:hypothetical protein QFC21_003910 [Naganishia friedmannii]